MDLHKRRRSMDSPLARKPARPTAAAGRSAARARPGRGSGVQTVYETLRFDILEMRMPPGEPLDETRLSLRFKMSRTPVREALVRLAAEGLVATLPNRNTIVAPIDFSNLPVYFDALTLMHRVTARLAAMRRTDADLAEIAALGEVFSRAVAEADALAMIAANRDFHLAIAHAGRNSYFTDLFRRLLDEGRRLHRLYYQSFNDQLPRQYVDEHDAILRALAERDADLADRLAGDHARQVVQQIQSYLASGIGSSIDLRPDASASR